METATETVPDRALWLKRRRTTRRALLGFTLLFAVFFVVALWLNEQNSQQWLQQSAQYRQDCGRVPESPDCRVLTMQVSGYREEGDTDSANYHNWLVLESKSGQELETEDWKRPNVGDLVTVLVWNGEAEEISDNGAVTQTEANPTLRAQAAHGNFVILEIIASIWLCLAVPLTFIGADKLHEKQWRLAAGNNACK